MRGSLALVLVVAGCSDPEPDRRDAESDATLDAGDASDANADAPDAGELPAPVRALAPTNGFATGSVHVPLDATIAEHPLRPVFRWLPAAGATSYEIEIDDSCAPETFRACELPSIELSAATAETQLVPDGPLEVARVAPVGRRYYWRVRACNDAGCSAFSEVRYLDVGRQRGDFNGDGYADAAIAARDQDAPEVDEGNVFVFDGSADGLATSAYAIDCPDDQSGAFFGVGLAIAGDLDADGYGDLVVGANAYDGPEHNEGRAFVFLGGASGISATPDVTIDAPLDATNGIFGGVVAGPGDLDGDGYADLAINAAGVGASVGTAYVFYGRSDGVGDAPDRTLDSPSGQAGANFGVWTGGAGDIDADGFPDLAIGAYLYDDIATDEGVVYVFHGGSTGIEGTPRETLENPAHDAAAAFGVRTAGGDLEGDGYSDLAVAAYLQDAPEIDEGNVLVFRGGPTGLESTPTATIDNPGDDASAAFGVATVIGDLDGDGAGELVIGAFLQHGTSGLGEGSAFSFAGSPTGIDASAARELRNPTRQLDGSFGIAASVPGDLDGDGYADLVIGAYLQSEGTTGEGVLYVYYGRREGVSASPDLAIVNPAADPDGHFGRTIAF